MMSPARIALKQRLLDERRILCLNPRGISLSCPCELCHRTGHDGLDLHEVIISRGDVRGNEALTTAVTESELNVALVCKECHAQHADTEWGRQFLADQLICRYGSREIVDWIHTLGLKCPDDFLNFVIARAGEMEK